MVETFLRALDSGLPVIVRQHTFIGRSGFIVSERFPQDVVRQDIPHSWVGHEVWVKLQHHSPTERYTLVDVGALGFTLQVEPPRPPSAGDEGTTGLVFYPWSTVESIRLAYTQSE